MSKTKGFLAAVATMAFTFSCSSDGENGGDEKFSYCILNEEQMCLDGPFTLEGCNSSGGKPSNSCPYGGSSSSSAVGVPTPTKTTFIDSRDGKTYKKVTIGTQVWMAENLNYNASGSVCYNNNSANCVTYGRLYNWETAKTVCPSGWRLPSQADWEVMTAYIGGARAEGRKLKATSGWNENSGTDEYGFSALPGGGGSSGGNFFSAGDRGYWWSATEINSYYAYGRIMYYYYESAYWGYDDKFYLFSVRCLQD